MSDELTIGEAVTDSIGSTQRRYDAVPNICAALGLDPSTLLANVVVLQPGQHVVEKRQEVKPGEHTLTEGSFWTPWVVVRSAVES